MSGAEDIWRTSEETARAMDFTEAMRMTDEALRLLEETSGPAATHYHGSAPSGAPGLVTWRREVRDGNVAYDGPWPPAQALGDYPPRCGRCGRPAGHETPPCPSCPDRNRMALAELGLRPPPGNLGMPPRRFPERELTEAEMDYVRQSWEEAMARARRQRPGNPVQVLGYERDDKPIPEPAPPPPPPPDIEAETWALLAEPGFLTENQFPQYDAVPAGCCTHCHGPMEPGRSGNCIYCFTLAGMGPVPPRPPVRRTRDLSGIRSPVLIIAAGTMLIAAAHWTPWLVIPAVILFAAGCLWRVKR